jgi:hypothetical protein
MLRCDPSSLFNFTAAQAKQMDWIFRLSLHFAHDNRCETSPSNLLMCKSGSSRGAIAPSAYHLSSN